MVQLNGKHNCHENTVPFNVDWAKQVAVMERSDVRQRLPSSFDWSLSSRHMASAIANHLNA